MRRATVGLIVAMVALLAACVSPHESGVKVIVGAKLGSLDYSVVVIADGKFRAVGSQAATPVPKGSEITSGLRMTLEPIPGGTPIEAGQPADLILKAGSVERTMRHGEWVQ